MPPRILFQSTERTLYFEEGDVVQLECVAYGYPMPRYIIYGLRIIDNTGWVWFERTGGTGGGGGSNRWGLD